MAEENSKQKFRETLKRVRKNEKSILKNN